MISSPTPSPTTTTGPRRSQRGDDHAHALSALSPSFFCTNALAGAPSPPPNHPSVRPDLPGPSLAQPGVVSCSPRRARRAGALGTASHALQRRHGKPQCRSHGAAAAVGSLPPCARSFPAAVHCGPGGPVPRPGPQVSAVDRPAPMRHVASKSATRAIPSPFCKKTPAGIRNQLALRPF